MRPILLARCGEPSGYLVVLLVVLAFLGGVGLALGWSSGDES